MPPRIDHYIWSGGRELLLRFGPDSGPVVLLALPLFEEANRTRTFAVGLLRRLAAQGIAGLLPDVPGQGESLVPLADVSLDRMREAIGAATAQQRAGGRPVYAVGLRSGVLLQTGASFDGHWQFAPQTGDALLRELHRIWRAAGHDGDRTAMIRGAATIEIAGNILSKQLLADIAAADPPDRPGVPRRIVRLDSDAAPADRHIAAAPLWRRPEPGDDPVLSETLTRDIAEWLATCAA